MSGPLKKARAVYPLEEYVSEDEEPQQDEFVGQTIDVDFDAFKAEDGDYHGIKRLLAQCFRDLDIDNGGIADIIISQNYVGSVVKQVRDEDGDDDDMEDEDDVFGVSTIINLTSRKDEDPVSKLRTSLVEKCQKFGSDSTNAFVRESLGNESKHVGLLISERLVNLPPQFALPVYDSLVKEVAAAKGKGMSYDFTYLLIICKIYREIDTKKSGGENIIWSNPEEEIFYEESLSSFEYKIEGSDSSLNGEWEDDDSQYVAYRRVLVIKGQMLPSIINKIRQAIS